MDWKGEEGQLEIAMKLINEDLSNGMEIIVIVGEMMMDLHEVRMNEFIGN